MLISGTSNSIIFEKKSMKENNEIKFLEVSFQIERWYEQIRDFMKNMLDLEKSFDANMYAIWGK